MKKLIGVLLALAFMGICLNQVQGQSAVPLKKTITLPRENASLKPGKGLDTVLINCSVCHSVDYISMQPSFSKAQWTGGVTKMIKVFGAKIIVEDAKIISDYLGEQYGTGN